MNSPVAGFDVLWLDEVDSTNRWLVDCVRRDPSAGRGRVVSARKQTAGIGRFHRSWISPPGRNLAFSLCWPTRRHLHEAASVSQAVALGVWSRLIALDLPDLSVKWPNDVRVRGRKICGILGEFASPSDVVIGVGLNVGLTAEEASAIDQPATSILIETGRTPELEPFLKSLLPPVRAELERWESGGFPALRDDYIRAAGGVGAPVRLRDGRSIIEGALAGFNDDGALRLRLPGGEECAFYAGDLEWTDSPAFGNG
ncbi:MAG: biotin--[acetyl-CoA-carboxylase] ligase [Kiritimatiellae bacterium]|nr:biotin--[acetyl-CoA-carboxylase] ligase [Kiritimatiellia bacterium]